MKQLTYALSILLTAVILSSSGNLLIAQSGDDPNLDRIPDEFLEYMQSQNRMPSTVITVDGYDNYYLGIDFAEGHISENPLSPGEYFTAFNIDETRYTMNGHDWFNSNPSWGGYYVRGDVLTAYDGAGNLYYENMYGSSIQGCVIVKSSDNGQTWSSPVVAVSGNDKNWLAADQTSGPYANYVYTTMTNNGVGNFARSTNGGASFQSTFAPGTQSLPGMMVCVGAWGSTDGGAVYVVTNSGNSFASVYTFYQSLDGGLTFTYKSAQNFANYVGSNVNGRNSVQNMRTRPYPFITADNSNGPYRGRLYLMYASNQPAGNGYKPDIFSRYSDDGGATWSSEVVVNDDFPSNNNSQWHPATWCDYTTGRLYVQWMDTRDTPTSDSALIYATYSDNGGQSFAQNHAISNQKMKINCTTCGGGGTPRYQGDYNGIVSNPVTSMSTWADFRNGSFASYTAYFPDYAMAVTPATGVVSGGIATFSAEVPSVKLWDEDVIFTAVMETPASGSFTVNYPSGNTLSSFPGTLPIEIVVNGSVPVGFYELTLTGEGSNGTPVHIRTASVEVVPMAPPTADFTASDQSPCEGTAIDFLDASTGSPDSWDWSFEGGTPATSTSQNPTGILYSTPGLYDVTLTASNSAGSNSNTKTDYIEVIVLPPPPAGSGEEVCFGESVPDLYADGTDIQWYDDPGLGNVVGTGNYLATGQTNPGIYTYYATQTVNGCESSPLTITLTIFALPEVGLQAFDPVCIDQPPFVLAGGTPEGGDYTGNGVVNNMFYPMTAGPGTHEITYTYTDANGCSNDSVQEITVNDLPEVYFDPLADVCIDAEAFTLTGGMPEGGTYAGPGVIDGMFYPELAGPGLHTITYTYTDEHGCTNSANQTIGVNELPQPDLGPDSSFCAGQSVLLDATTPNALSYEWYPGGQTTPTITVDTSGFGIGEHMFIAFVTDINNCTGSDTVMIEFQDCTGIGEAEEISNISIYPNPGQGIFTLQLSTEKPLEINIIVYNNVGVTIYEEDNRMLSGTEKIRIDLSDQPAGIYMLNVYNRNGKWIEKLIIRK
jgi:PKD repeat protein